MSSSVCQANHLRSPGRGATLRPNGRPWRTSRPQLTVSLHGSEGRPAWRTAVCVHGTTSRGNQLDIGVNHHDVRSRTCGLRLGMECADIGYETRNDARLTPILRALRWGLHHQHRRIGDCSQRNTESAQKESPPQCPYRLTSHQPIFSPAEGSSTAPRWKPGLASITPLLGVPRPPAGKVGASPLLPHGDRRS
jgi:hypothetical protein